MSIRDRLLGPCAVRNAETEDVLLDADAFLRRILLFDTYVVQSFDLKELPSLIELIGYDGLLDLLKTKALRFHSFRLFAGNLERQGPGLDTGEMRYSLAFDGSTEPARPGFYEITNVIVGDPEEEFHTQLQIAHSVPGLSQKQAIRLKKELASALIRIPNGFGQPSTSQTHAELDRSLSGLRRAVARLLSNRLGTEVAPDAVSLRLHREGEIACFFETNLTDSFGVDPFDAHRIVGEGLLALDRLNVRLELMRLCSAVSGMRDDEYPYFEDKLDFLVREFAPESHEERFQRVIEITGLPDLRDAFNEGKLNIKRLLDVRGSTECSEFRTWLRNVDDLEEEDIRDRVNSLRARLGTAAHAPVGKAFRLATTSAVGFIPIVGPILGIGASALDSFMLDEVLPDAGPIAFLTNLYPSLFEK